jgi:FAD/FMN-containing dehydrogenase
MSDVIPRDTFDVFRAAFSGRVVLPEDSDYDEVRAVHNGTVDKRPALIARCQNTADIVDAVRVARDAGLEISVRGGGHNVAGRAVTDGGLMIDLQGMKGVHVDPGSHVARAQAGLTWREYNRATHAFGLASTGGVISTTGIAGLTMGGGIGWLMGKYGMAIDNLRAAEVVTADGEVRTATDEADGDLFWAIRGGGGNFGVASSFEFNVHPLSSVLGGIIAFDLPDAAKVIDFYRDFTAASPDELTAFCGLVHAPDGSGHQIVALPICHCGGESQAQRAADQIRTAAAPLVDLIGPMPYPTINTLLDDAYPKGARNYWKSAFFKELSDDTIEIMIECFKKVPSIMSGMLIEHFHGQVTTVSATATAYPHREAGYDLLILGQWLDPNDDDTNRDWVRATFASLAPHMADAAYVNYLDDDDANRIQAAYGPNWERLVTLKKRYDPENIFHLNQNIDPNG